MLLACLHNTVDVYFVTFQAAPGNEGAGYSGDRPGGHNEHLTLHQAQLGERLYPRVSKYTITSHVSEHLQEHKVIFSIFFIAGTLTTSDICGQNHWDAVGVDACPAFSPTCQ